MHCNGKHIFCMLKDLKVVFAKGPGSQPILSENGMRPIWKKVVYGPLWICSYQASRKVIKAIISKGRQATIASLCIVMVSTYLV